MNTFPNSRTDDVAGAAHTRPLAHAIALRLLTAKGADAAGLKRFVASSGLAEAMVDVLEELTRRVRAMRVEFEDLAASSRPRAGGGGRSRRAGAGAGRGATGNSSRLLRASNEGAHCHPEYSEGSLVAAPPLCVP